MSFVATTPAAETSAATPLAAIKGWHADPLDQHDLRYHDGEIWTEHVTHFGPVPCQGCNVRAIR